jgi:8-oxo-dGTP pyrophosphatase MutT (NUDIX family)
MAAVLLPLIINSKGTADLLLTKRPRMLNAHGGEVSFPGGSFEEIDSSLEETALRETFEEIGIEQKNINIIGVLDDCLSKNRLRVTPFVGIISEPFEVKLSESEVEKVYRIPLAYFLNSETSWTERWIRNGETRTVYFHRYEDDIIWGLTAQIIGNFLSITKLLDI